MLYTEADLETFTPAFRGYLRRAAAELHAERKPSRGTQLNMALHYWKQDNRLA